MASEQLDSRLSSKNGDKMEIAGLALEGTDIDELCCVAQLMLMASIKD